MYTITGLDWAIELMIRYFPNVKLLDEQRPSYHHKKQARFAITNKLNAISLSLINLSGITIIRLATDTLSLLPN